MKSTLKMAVLAIGSFFICHAYAQFDFDDSLAAYWIFDDVLDSTPDDEAPLDMINDELTLINNVQYSTDGDLPFFTYNISTMEIDVADDAGGPNGNDYYGLNSFAEAQDSADLDMSGSFTVAAWVKPSVTWAEQNIISKDTISNRSNYNLSLWAEGSLNTVLFAVMFDAPINDYQSVLGNTSCSLTNNYCIARTTNTIDQGIPLMPLGDWHHVAGVYDDISKTMKVYVNGVIRAQTNVDTLGSPEVNSATLQLGHRKGVVYTDYEGKIDEVRIYSLALHPGQIQEVYEYGSTGPKANCAGFEQPMANYPVTTKKNCALPLKTKVFNADGVALTDLDLVAPPVVQVLYDSGTGGDPVDVTYDVLAAGQGTEGNQFVFTDDLKWQFNLKTSNYSGSGTYTVIMESGDLSEYVIDPTCLTEFIVK